MKLIQSYFNHRITKTNINFSGGYLSPIVNWLSMAYSCLLLKRNNPNEQLFFYGNETIVHLFERLFKLPYDEFRIIESKGEYADWFYCWPKIITYQEQDEPFIHIDTDVFMWKSMPQRLLNSPLVAQHMERDSNFYMEVYKQIEEDGIRLPQFLADCNDGKYINSYNAGLLGGNDIEFLRDYLNEISNFLNENKDKILHSDRKFLYNVVFEQWLFYGLSKKMNKKVCTFYKEPITDFDMDNAKVPKQILSLNELEYLHVMEHKDNIRCNRFIAYQMQADFPQEYEKILSVCKDYGIKSGFYTIYTSADMQDCDIFTRSKRLREETGLSNTTLKGLITFEELTASILLNFQSNREVAIEEQTEFRKILRLNAAKGMKNANYKKAILSPYVQIVDADSSLVKLLLYNAKRVMPKEAVIVLVYNAIFNRVDEFIWTRQRLQLLLSLIEENDALYFLSTNTLKEEKLNEVSTFLKQCLFDGIITLV